VQFIIVSLALWNTPSPDGQRRCLRYFHSAVLLGLANDLCTLLLGTACRKRLLGVSQRANCASHAGFSLASKGVQVVTKPDKEGNQMGTGVAYVRFQNPSEAEKARKERHRQQMGSRYIECLPFTASHYTSPAIPPQLAVPPPYALSQYPGGAMQRPYAPLGSVGCGIPPQPPPQQYGEARVYAQQQMGLRGPLPHGAPLRGRPPAARGRSMLWVPTQQQPAPPPVSPGYGARHPGSRPGPGPGRGYPSQVKAPALLCTRPRLTHSLGETSDAAPVHVVNI
jgi:hypothetical protein